MIKLILFTDTNAVWSDILLPPLHLVSYRRVENLNVLPEKSILEFNCSEIELFQYSKNRKLFSEKVKEYYVPFASHFL